MIYKSINYWTFGPSALDGKYDIVQAMKEAKEAGFDAIELCLATSGQLTFNASEKKCKKLLEESKKIGIKICSVATGVYWGVNPASPKKSERAKALKLTKQALQITKWLGTNTFLYVPGVVALGWDPKSPVLPYGEVYDRALAQLKAAAKTAEKLGVYICVENVWNKFLYSPVEMRDFIKKANSRYVAQYFDPGNVVEIGYPDHWIPVLGKLIKRVHCKDYKRDPGGFPKGFEVPIGEGETNWPLILKQLQKIKYNGPISAEIISFTEDPERVKRVSKELGNILKTIKQ